jgi:hypothetical protein
VTALEPQGAPSGEGALDIRIIGGNPSPEEVAATTAVVGAVLEELVAQQARVDVAVPTAWSRNQRPFRAPITPGAGAWRSFSG